MLSRTSTPTTGMRPDHLEQMVALHERTGAVVCTAARKLVDLSGRLLGACSEVDGEKFVDTSSLFLTRAAFGVIAAWYRMPRALAPIGDRVVWKAVKDEKLTRSHHCLPTVNYRTKYIEHYTYFRQPPPPGATHVRIKTNAKGDYVDAEVLVGPRRAF